MKTVKTMIEERYEITFPFKAFGENDKTYNFLNELELYDFLETTDIDIYAVPFYRCISCGEKIYLMFPESDPDKIKDIDVDNEPWVDGFVGTINVGYGSKYDGDVMGLGVCDDCVRILREQGKLNHIRK